MGFLRKLQAKLPPPNRVGAYLTGAAALAAAAAPVVADLDLTSTIGLLGGATALVGVYREWLKGWRAHEMADLRLNWGPAVDPPAPSVTVEAPKPAPASAELLVQVPVAEQPGAVGLTTAWVPLSSLATQPVTA